MDDTLEEFGWREGASRVVHEHQPVLVEEDGQAGGHRLAAIRPTRDDVDDDLTLARPWTATGVGHCGRRDLAGRDQPGSGRHDDQMAHVGAGETLVQRPAQQRTSVEFDERLGNIGPQSETTARGDDDDSDAQEANTSSSMLDALSSSVFSASASSETRI
ncbi:hypothetical protein GCM10025883_30240 [Mobilicoccus caccae]|uniref:Uncharacterized protein n=1 Tax=Mobilicoccus caccae TaxID=1859295 RepID=A0ABQ6IW86_9MICO|nr:hypothetical protein GCM10025883_30240 [Mobilicoccus caccae]